jgi:hypothetical protein
MLSAKIYTKQVLFRDPVKQYENCGEHKENENSFLS